MQPDLIISAKVRHEPIYDELSSTAPTVCWKTPGWRGLRRRRQLSGQIHEVSDTIWMTAVGPQGAQQILDDLARAFEVDPAR